MKLTGLLILVSNTELQAFFSDVILQADFVVSVFIVK